MIQPFGNNILVEPVENKQILVSENKSLCEYGKVLAVGSEVKHIKVGDTIGFTVWGVNTLKVGDKVHRFLPEDPAFLLGTINEV